MRATLPQGASTTYYGQWNARFLRETPANRPFHCPKSPRRGGDFSALEARARGLPEKRGSAYRTFDPSRRENSGRLFQPYPPPSARPLLDHTRDAAAGSKLAPMIKVDQLILAAVACLVAVHLLPAG